MTPYRKSFFFLKTESNTPIFSFVLMSFSHLIMPKSCQLKNNLKITININCFLASGFKIAPPQMLCKARFFFTSFGVGIS